MTVAILGLPAGLQPRADQLEELKQAGTIDYYETRRAKSSATGAPWPLIARSISSSTSSRNGQANTPARLRGRICTTPPSKSSGLNRWRWKSSGSRNR